MTREPAIRLAPAGDTMLGRMVARAIAQAKAAPVAAEVVAVAAEADLFVLNLECCISDRGERWPEPGKPLFFRAPPLAAELLAEIGVDCVTLANNHALDYGRQALMDTFDHLRTAGVTWDAAALGIAPATTRARPHLDGLLRFERMYIVRPYESAESVRRRLGFRAPDVESAAPRHRAARACLERSGRRLRVVSARQGRLRMRRAMRRDSRGASVVRPWRAPDDIGRLVAHLAEAPAPKRCA